MRKTYTEEERSDLIGLVRARRATVAEAAEQVGVTLSTAYKWMRDAAPLTTGTRRTRPSSTGTPTFVRVVPSFDTTPAICVRVGAAEIQVRRDFDADVLRAVVEVLRGVGP
jgi:transposase